jgi:hypothetical protein
MNMETHAIVEELVPELRPYVCDWPPFGKMLDHPLVRVTQLDARFKNALPGTPRTNVELANRSYRDKRAQLTAAVDSKDWHSYVFLHERPHRLDALYSAIYEYDIAERVSGRLWLMSGATARISMSLSTSGKKFGP